MARGPKILFLIDAPPPGLAEKLDKPIMPTGGEGAAYKLWPQLSDEWNRYLDGVKDELIGRANSGTP